MLSARVLSCDSSQDRGATDRHQRGCRDGAARPLRSRLRARLLRRECARQGLTLPPPGEYGAGLVFLPREPMQADKVRALLHSIVDEEGQSLLGWRDVPTDDRLLGDSARAVEPTIKQVF